MAAPSRPAARPRPGGKPGAAKGRAPLRRKPVPKGMDLYHLLAVVSGAFAGLVLYSLLTPGQVPMQGDQAVTRTDPRASLKLVQLKGGRGADGLMHVSGQVMNGRSEACRLASVTVRFLDAGGQEMASTLATVNDIPGRGRGPFSVRAHAPGAVSFEVALDLAQFEPAHGRP